MEDVCEMKMRPGCGAREWKEAGEVGKGEEMWFISLEEEEERMEEEVDEERTSVGMGGGG